MLIKSGFAKFRASAPPIYAARSPGFSRAAAEYLMEALAGLHTLLVDFISAVPSQVAQICSVTLGLVNLGHAASVGMPEKVDDRPLTRLQQGSGEDWRPGDQACAILPLGPGG